MSNNNIMNLDNVFSSSFHQNAHQFNNQLRQPFWKLKPVQLFPLKKYITDGDQFFKTVWRMIDQSQKYFWITTYAMDSSPVADTTLLKLIDAAKRGVHVILFIDNVQYWAKGNLIQQLKNAGGKFMALNPQFRFESISKYFTKDVWRRHHEKLIVSDNKGIIGSSNMEIHYAGIRYGNSNFMDFNLYSENIILDEYRKHFIDTSNSYKFNLETGQKYSQNASETNANFLKQFDKIFPNSNFYRPGKYKLLHNNQKIFVKEIEEDICKRIESATKQIKIIQPYHFQMLKFDNLMTQAKKRGILPQIITSGERDQPVFKDMLNSMLFSRLLKKGIKIYETRQRLLHSKVYLFDGKWVNLGSMNNDRWSWKINNELNILIEDERDYEEVLSYYETLKKRCKPVTKKYKIEIDKTAQLKFWQWFIYQSEIVMSKSGKPEEDYIETEHPFQLDDQEK